MGKKKERLCYIDGNKAYFTRYELNKVEGDDWGDVPYEHNAGPPYDKFVSSTLYFETDMQRPCDGFFNSPYSVKYINKGIIPWLREPEREDRQIFAGLSKAKFIEFIIKNGGEIYKNRRKRNENRRNRSEIRGLA